MSDDIDWTYWKKLPEVKVFEALALLEGVAPESEPPDIEGATPQYRKALRLLLACLSDRSAFTPGTVNLGDPALHGVRLLEVGRWAKANGYTLPDKFPRPVPVSNAPPPITPLRGGGYGPSRRPSPANWNKWKHIPKCELWQAVCLTLDIEPDDEKHGIRSWLQSRRGLPYGFTSEFADRLDIAQANVSTNGPIRPQALYAGVLRSPHGQVLLSEIAAAAIGWGWTLPESMQALARTAAPAREDAPESIGTARVKPVQRTAAQDAAILATIRSCGHDPQALPTNEHGRPGVKAETRAALVGVNPLFPTNSTVFDKAWERLRQSGDIADAA